ncbi:MAG: 4Fe-4S dicluster domain-containing protein [Actinomycetota bacterium]|nr:4Fe-4S dicluster domain-containing protein [Actinomycetota bacterium]
MQEDKYADAAKHDKNKGGFGMKLVKKDDFLNFVNTLIKNDSRTVVGVKSKRNKFIYDTLNSADELRLEYDVTMLSPNKYFLPPTETLLRYDFTGKFSVQAVNEVTPLIIIGIHPYDLIAIEQMDKVFKDSNPDYNYIRKREASILIGTNIQNVSSYAFSGSMGAATTDRGFDLMLTNIGDKYAIEIGSIKGKNLIEKYAKVSEADNDTTREVQRIKTEIGSKFEKQLNFSSEELPKLLEENYDNELWEKNAQKCLSCGSCNFVCPTCYCFDVQDITELNLKTGERIRTWDGCLLEDFAKVATGENFRKDRAARYRHRFMRKGKYLYDKFGFIACIGCGRCASSCLPDIADPCKVFNSLKEVIE